MDVKDIVGQLQGAQAALTHTFEQTHSGAVKHALDQVTALQSAVAARLNPDAKALKAMDWHDTIALARFRGIDTRTDQDGNARTMDAIKADIVARG